MITSYGGFYASSFPSTTLTNANTFYPINWDTVYPVNANIIQNLSNSTLTVLVAGVYQINCTLSFQTNLSIGTNYIEFSALQNGNPLTMIQSRISGFSTNYQTASLSGLIFCAPNDTLNIGVSINSTGYSLTMLDGANFTTNLIKYILD